MRLGSYYKYFCFIWKHWDFNLAAFTIFHEIAGERKYGINTTGTEALWQYDIDDKDLALAEAYQPSSYYILEQLFPLLPGSAKTGRIYDFGSGKGRTLVVAMAYGFKKLTGVEIIYELAKDTETNIINSKHYHPGISFEVLNQRAQSIQIRDDATVFLFFNPFKEELMLACLKNIMASYERSPRPLYVMYINDVYRHLFIDRGFKEVFHIRKLFYLQGTLLSYGEDKPQ